MCPQFWINLKYRIELKPSRVRAKRAGLNNEKSRMDSGSFFLVLVWQYLSNGKVIADFRYFRRILLVSGEK
jgi:hypothetical protein